ncbi:MAG: hypothetical protein A2V65_09445 [Deltaproteobacteria bacterium RBG_13_49_15]|nr:MAG: hypothetical protein A2V65_09445 [Deltaproteobacteria bacterium RBG_13_49_15]
MKLEYIPKYHPELNFQERLWRMMRYEKTTNTYYEIFEQMDRAVFNRSRIQRPDKIQSLCHVI